MKFAEANPIIKTPHFVAKFQIVHQRVIPVVITL